MAVISPSRYDLVDTAHLKGHVWEGVANGDTGRPISFKGYRDARVMIHGDFGSGTAVFQGTDDPRGDPDHADHASAVWLTLDDEAGTAISVTANALKAVSVPALWLRPSLSGGSAGSLTVSVIAGGLK